MTCKGSCIRYKATKSSSYSSHYGLGHKRCSKCEIFIKWNGTHCPCCGITLRTRPKSTSGRYQLLLVRQSRKKNRWSVRLQFSDSNPNGSITTNPVGGFSDSFLFTLNTLDVKMKSRLPRLHVSTNFNELFFRKHEN